MPNTSTNWPSKISRSAGSFVWVLAVGIAPIGHLQFGALSVAIGLSNTLAVNGAILVFVGLVVAVAAPRLRQRVVGGYQ